MPKMGILTLDLFTGSQYSYQQKSAQFPSQGLNMKDTTKSLLLRTHKSSFGYRDVAYISTNCIATPPSSATSIHLSVISFMVSVDEKHHEKKVTMPCRFGLAVRR